MQSWKEPLTYTYPTPTQPPSLLHSPHRPSPYNDSYLQMYTPLGVVSRTLYTMNYNLLYITSYLTSLLPLIIKGIKNIIDIRVLFSFHSFMLANLHCS